VVDANRAVAMEVNNRFRLLLLSWKGGAHNEQFLKHVLMEMNS